MCVPSLHFSFHKENKETIKMLILLNIRLINKPLVNLSIVTNKIKRPRLHTVIYQKTVLEKVVAAYFSRHACLSIFNILLSFIISTWIIRFGILPFTPILPNREVELWRKHEARFPRSITSCNIAIRLLHPLIDLYG